MRSANRSRSSRSRRELGLEAGFSALRARLKLALEGFDVRAMSRVAVGQPVAVLLHTIALRAPVRDLGDCVLDQLFGGLGLAGVARWTAPALAAAAPDDSSSASRVRLRRILQGGDIQYRRVAGLGLRTRELLERRHGPVIDRRTRGPRASW